MNPDVMEAVGRYVQNRPGQKPVIKAITNGTILSERHKQIVRDYQIKVVFSIDGPPAVHDAGRIFRDGRGTFQKIYENFQELRAYTDGKQPYSIDVTYSGIHERNGLSVNDVVWYLSDLFDVRPSKVNVSVISAQPDSPYTLKDPMCMVKSAEDALERARSGDDRTHMKLRSVIRRLKNRALTGDSVCDACKSWAAVSYQGELYPCLMFMDRAEYAMGPVTPEMFLSEKYHHVYDRFQSYRKKTHWPCCDCIAKNVCAACMGINEYYTGDLHTSSPAQCRETQRIVQTAIEGIAEGIW